MHLSGIVAMRSIHRDSASSFSPFRTLLVEEFRRKPLSFGLPLIRRPDDHIAGRLAGAKSLAAFDDDEGGGGGGSNFTAAAFAAGTIVSTDTKIAALVI